MALLEIAACVASVCVRRNKKDSSVWRESQKQGLDILEEALWCNVVQELDENVVWDVQSLKANPCRARHPRRAGKTKKKAKGRKIGITRACLLYLSYS